jgi:hypothetical protein
MKRLGITMIPADSPEARGRSERAFATHQDRLVKELALAGITTGGSEPLPPSDLSPRVQRAICRPRARDRNSVCTLGGGRFIGTALRALRAGGRGGQLCEVCNAEPTNPGRPASLPLRQSEGTGSSCPRWKSIGVSRTEKACRLHTRGKGGEARCQRPCRRI